MKPISGPYFTLNYFNFYRNLDYEYCLPFIIVDVSYYRLQRYYSGREAPSQGFGSGSFFWNFFLFTSHLNMQASISCVLGLVTCHLNEAIWQPALARVVVLHSWF